MPNLVETARIRGRLSLSELVALNDFIWSIPSCTIRIDFREYTYSSIFDLTFLAHQFRAVQFKKNIKIEAINHDHMVWAQNMNFFSASGTDWASQVAAREGDGVNYIPITIIDCQRNGKQFTRAEMNEEIDQHAVKLANVLLHLGSGAAFDTIQYTFREMIRNIFEHSGSKSFLMSGQYYPKHRNVQIVLADDGQGIPNSLRFNRSFSKLGDKDALNFSLMPGVSGNEKAMTTFRQDIWQNSGYGLYMMTRLARNKGMMTVISGDQIIHINDSDNEVLSKENFAIANFRGTIIRIGIHVTTEDLSKRLQTWADEGKNIARDIVGAKQIDASAASLLLRRDFERYSKPS